MTTPQVVQLTHCVDAVLIARLFARFKGRYGNLWTSRASSDGEWEFIMEDWLQELSKFSFEQVRSAVNKTTTEYPTYPPTLGQLIELCMKESGLPEPHEVIRFLIARDFSHPLVKIIYDKIGGWALSNSREEEIERKVKEHYQSSRSEFHIEPKKSWAQLESFNAKPKKLPPPPKIPTVEERKSFREQLAEYQQKIEDAKLECKGLPYKEFDENKIRPTSRDFNQAIYDEFREYLISIPDRQVMILPVSYMNQRRKFLNMIEQAELLKELGYNPNGKIEQEEPKRQYEKPTRVYKTWAAD